MSFYEKIIYSLYNSLELSSNAITPESYASSLYEKYDECIKLLNSKNNQKVLLNEYDIKQCQTTIHHYWLNILDIHNKLPKFMQNYYKFKYINYMELHKQNPYLYKLESSVKSKMEKLYIEK